MFVKNFKLNSKMIFKIIFVILFILIFIMCIFGVAKMLRSKEQTTNPSNNVSKGNINVLTTRNYTNVLKTVHSDMLERKFNLQDLYIDYMIFQMNNLYLEER